MSRALRRCRRPADGRRTRSRSAPATTGRSAWHATRTVGPPRHRRPPRRRRLEARSAPTTASRRTSPTRASAPSQRTELYVVYDDRALYIGVRAWDSDAAQHRRAADAARSRHRRRQDRTSTSARSNDRTTAYHFEVNVAGVLHDGVRFNDTDYSSDWDGLWLGAAHRDANGWSAEWLHPAQDPALRRRPQPSSASRCAA